MSGPRCSCHRMRWAPLHADGWKRGDDGFWRDPKRPRWLRDDKGHWFSEASLRDVRDVVEEVAENVQFPEPDWRESLRRRFAS